MAYASSDVDCFEEARLLSEPGAARRSASNYFKRPWLVLSLVGIVASAVLLTRSVAFKANQQPTASLAKPVLKLAERQLQPTLEFRTVESQLPGPWINRQQLVQEESHQLISATNATRSSGADARHLSSTCNNLDHLITIGKQVLTPPGPDDLFPASASSIAPPGANCGDTAQNLHVSCDKYNVWTTFQAISKAKGKPFSVISKSGPDWHDVGQGELGVCYFLAALASVAHDDPGVISRLFIETDKWEQGVFTTKWFVNGRETTVKVDGKVPGQGARAFFAQPSDSGEWWPVILEKAWAKIFQNYKNTEGGTWTNPVLALTGAPVFNLNHDKVGADEIWKALRDATTEHWPAGTGTGNSQAAQSIGLVSGHAYSVFNATVHPTHGKIVQCYNPWGKDSYKGAIPNSNKADGVFEMTLAEYKASFHSTMLAHVHSSFTPSSKLVQTEQSRASASEFKVTSSDKFYVSVTWPTPRMTRECGQQPQPKVTLAVSKKGSSTVHMAEDGVYGSNSQSVMITEGAGEYVASALLHFPQNDQVHEAHLVVYGKDQVSITPGSGDAEQTLMSLIGPAKHGQACHTVSFPGLGLFVMDKSQLVNGVPTFWGHDGEIFAYWATRSGEWYAITKAKLDSVKAGELWSSKKFSKDSIVCGCQDDPKGVGGFSTELHCNQVKGQAAKYGNVKCEGTKYSKLVQRFCPVTCAVPACSGPGTVPTAAPTPGPKPDAGTDSQCSDRTDKSFKLPNSEELVTCARTELCNQPEFERDHCCESCANAAKHGGDNPTCEGEDCKVEADKKCLFIIPIINFCIPKFW